MTVSRTTSVQWIAALEAIKFSKANEKIANHGHTGAVPIADPIPMLVFPASSIEDC
jgi:hypothetical protein